MGAGDRSLDRLPCRRHSVSSTGSAHNASELIGLRCSSYASDGLRARERNFDLGSLRLADIAGNEHVVERTLPIVRRHPKDSIFACMLLQGEAFFYQAGRCVPVHEGDLIVYGTTIPYLYGFTREMRQILVDIDAAQLLRGGRVQRPTRASSVEAGLRAGRMLAAALRRSLVDFVERPLADDAERVAYRVRTLLEALLVSPDAPSRHDESAALRLLRAESFIAEHLADPDLDAERVAAAPRDVAAPSQPSLREARLHRHAMDLAAAPGLRAPLPGRSCAAPSRSVTSRCDAASPPRRTSRGSSGPRTARRRRTIVCWLYPNRVDVARGPGEPQAVTLPLFIRDGARTRSPPHCYLPNAAPFAATRRPPSSNIFRNRPSRDRPSDRSPGSRARDLSLRV